MPAYELQLTGEGIESSDRRGLISSYCIAPRGHRLPFWGEGGKPPGWAICLGVDRPGPWWTKSFMEKPAITRANFSDVRLIMAIMRVLEELSLSQAVMGQISILEFPFVGCAWVPAITSFHAKL
jgi:hypothetical protein